MSLPLSGVRVLDLSTVLAAPLVASLLAEYGADVIKVERPGLGDPVRAYPPFIGDTSLHHKVTNKGKRSVTVDLNVPEGADVALQLAATSDVVVTNFRPSTLRRWNLDYPSLQAARPDLIVLHLTAFGRSGPYAERPGFARIAEALAGLTQITGYPDRPPVFAGYPIADGIAGIHGAFAVMVALHHRAATGEGQLIDLALYEPLLRMMEDLVVGAGATGVSKERVGNAQANVCPNGMFPTCDGEYVIIPASTSRMWERLISLMDAEDLRPYSTNAIRILHRDLIESRIADWTRQRTRDSLLALLEQHGIAVGRLYSATEILEDPHIQARGSVVEVYDEELNRRLKMPAPVPTFSTIRTQVGTPGTQLGLSTDSVMRERLHKSDAEIALMRDCGAIGPTVSPRPAKEAAMTNLLPRFSALVAGRHADPAPKVESLDLSFLDPGDLGVHVLWSSVNYKDALAAQPDGNVARKTPLIPGIDLVGEVVDAAGDFEVGDLVVVHGYDLGVAHHGGYAQTARVPVGWAFPLPPGMTPREAMILGTAGFTAAMSIVQLEERGLVPAAGPVLVTGATGGVGSAAVAIFAGRGYDVVASSGKGERCESWLRTLGAVDVIGRIEVPDKPKPLAAEAWAAVVDSVGGPQLAQVLSTVKYGGGVAASGVTAGPGFNGSVFPHILRGVALLGIDSVGCALERRTSVWQRMASDLRPKDIDALCGGEVILDGVPEELDRILRGEMIGRTVVHVGA